jgi:photosystem II stability/assembly factor-like uncharacterized protein
MTRRLTLAALAATFACAVFATFGAASVNVAQSGWSWGNPTPQGNTLNSIDFVEGRGYAAGEAGAVLRTDDGGANWTGTATGTSADLTRLQVLDPDTLTVLGGNGCVLRRSDDAGKTYHKIFIVAEQNCPAPVAAFTFVDRATGYLLLRDGSVLRTADAGQTFSRQTAIPGTDASNSPAGRKAVEVAFTQPDVGIVFLQPGNGPVAYSTTDGGVSWKPLDGVDGSVRRVWFLDGQHGWAVGAATLLQTEDGGKTWVPRAGASGRDLTAIRCSDTSNCILTTAAGDKLLRTDDGGGVVTEITPSSQAIFAASFSSPTHVVAVGANGATVISDDAGANYKPISTDIGGSFTELQSGPVASMAFALGKRGALAVTNDGGNSWRNLAVPTSHDLLDAAFAAGDTGYALDGSGGLFKTSNAGKTWQTLDTGSPSPPRAIASPAPDVVLVVGPTGIRRGVGAAQPQPVGNRTLRRSNLTSILTHGNLLVAYGEFGKHVFLSTDGGKTWRTINLPKRATLESGRTTDFVSTKTGFFLDTNHRLWKTTNGGKKWVQQLGVGTTNVRGITMSDGNNGWLNGALPENPQTGITQVLRTSDGGKTWRPQEVARGGPLGDVLATASLKGYMLLGDNRLFFTQSGGDAGAATALTLRTAKRSYTKKQFKKANGRVTVSGSIPGAVGGEQIVVSRRDLRGTGWVHQIVTAGANGGSFTTSWKIKRTSVFVAQWAGDSGRRGAGSVPLTISVQR